MITMSTVGYGDIYPKTTLGKVIAIMIGVWGMFLMSMVVIILFEQTELTYDERKSLLTYNKLQLKAKLKNKAVQIIQLNWLAKKYNK